MPDGTVKLAAGWLIDACGWKGKSVGRPASTRSRRWCWSTAAAPPAARWSRSRGAIQTSVYERFGIRLEPEPVVV
jgi:UDP-N-acetylmuramate dehydrogenase